PSLTALHALSGTMSASRVALGAAMLAPMALGFLAPISLPRGTSNPAGAISSATTATSAAAASSCSGRRAPVTAVRMSTRNEPQQKQQLKALEMTPRRKQFFRMVSEGLKVGFEGEDLSRVENFVRYCKGELECKALGPLHQPSEEYVEGLRAKPWWEPQEFEWISEMEERSSIVIDEFKAFWNDPLSGFAKDSVNMNIMGKGWSGVRLQRLGEWIPENCEKFPKTVKLLKELEIPLAVRGVMFARQVPGSGVSPHTDGRNFILTTHLGVDVPEDCWMRVGEEKRSWENGKALILDTSFEHETRNDSRRDRIVLIIDYWHPGMYPRSHCSAEQEALAFVYDLRNKFESGEIPLEEPEEKGFFGAFKRAFQQ
ncbi:unnamed protein product, partial [Ectocarpus sp. 6 AP-2014]